MIAILEPTVFAITDRGICRFCGKTIEMRRLIGWVHTERFYLCATQPDEETYNCAEPPE